MIEVALPRCGEDPLVERLRRRGVGLPPDIELLRLHERLVRHPGDVQRLEHLPLGVERCAVAADAVRVEHGLVDEEAGAAELEVAHPRRPRLVERVEQADHAAREVRPASLGERTLSAPLTGRRVQPPRGGQAVDPGLDPLVGEVRDLGERLGLRDLRQRHDAAEGGLGAFVERVDDPADLVPLDVPVDRRPAAVPVLREAVQRGELPGAELGHGHVGADRLEPDGVPRRVPGQAHRGGAECGGQLAALGHARACRLPAHEVAEPLLRGVVHGRVVGVLDLRGLGEQGVRGERRDVGRRGNVQACALLVGRDRSSPEAGVRPSDDPAGVRFAVDAVRHPPDAVPLVELLEAAGVADPPRLVLAPAFVRLTPWGDRPCLVRLQLNHGRSPSRRTPRAVRPARGAGTGSRPYGTTTRTPRRR